MAQRRDPVLDRVDGHHVPRGLDAVRLYLEFTSAAKIREENFRLSFQVGTQRVCKIPADFSKVKRRPVLRQEFEGPFAVAEEHHDEGVDSGERRVAPNSVYLRHRLLRAEVLQQEDLVPHAREGLLQVARVLLGSTAFLFVTCNDTL